MGKLKIPLVSLGAFVAGVLATVAMAQTINPERIQPRGPMPRRQRTGLACRLRLRKLFAARVRVPEV